MSEKVSTDIYEISDMVLDLEKKFMENVDENVLMVSSYGYLGSQFSKILKNSNRLACEWGNEYILTKSKFDSTILTRAVECKLENINAVPAKMNVMIGFIEEELLNSLKDGQLIISRDCLFEVGDFDYHLDHDLIIQAEKLLDGTYTYTARYIINEYSPNFSKIDDPYLASPIKTYQDNSTFVYIGCQLVQTSLEITETPIVSNNILENKTVEFTFKEQLAGFEITVISGSETINLTPIYEGMPNETGLYCYYNYLDTDTIRIKFDPNSYKPKNGDKVSIRIYSCEGEDGNFMYSKYVSVCLEDTDKYTYNGLCCLIKCEESTNGKDKMEISDIKKILPKEYFTNGVITTNADVENYFNNLFDNNKLKFFEKRHNQNEHLYYGYLIAKDESDNIIPTNTIDIEIYDEDFDTVNDRIVIKPNTRFVYNQKTKSAFYKEKEEETDKFVYSIPFNMVINKDFLSMSYYLDIIDTAYRFKYIYINNNSFLQFIASPLNVSRNFLVDDNYKFTMTLTQNTNMDEKLIEYNDDGSVKECKLQPVLVLSPDENHNYYVYGKVTGYDAITYSYYVEFEITTDGKLNEKNQLKLNDMYVGNVGGEKGSVYLNIQTDMSVYVYIKDENNIETNTMVPNLCEGHIISNIYKSINQLELLYNFSSIINTSVRAVQDNGKIKYKILGVPVVRKSYIEDIDRCNYFINILRYRKAYIDQALVYIENPFGIDFKFYNTYGPSEIFEIGYDSANKLDRVNLSLSFVVKFKEGIEDTEVIINRMKNDIREFIENINDISNSIHMGNLTTEIKNTYYNDIYFFDFIGINEYNALYKYIVKTSAEQNIGQVPELLCINLSEDSVPDISIKAI